MGLWMALEVATVIGVIGTDAYCIGNRRGMV